MLSRLTLLLSIAIFSYVSYAQDNPVNYCIARPVTCYPVLVPVCAFPAGCTDGSCSKNFENACSACQDVTMESYILGMCPDYVDPTDPAEIPPSEEEAETTGDEPEEEEEDSVSDSCPNLGVALQVNGAFVEGKFCCTVQPAACPLRAKPVCAVLYACIESTCQITMKNSCEACLDTNVQLYIPGTCEEIYGSRGNDGRRLAFQGHLEEEYIISEAEVPLYNSEEKDLWISWNH